MAQNLSSCRGGVGVLSLTQYPGQATFERNPKQHSVPVQRGLNETSNRIFWRALRGMGVMGAKLALYCMARHYSDFLFLQKTRQTLLTMTHKGEHHPCILCCTCQGFTDLLSRNWCAARFESGTLRAPVKYLWYPPLPAWPGSKKAEVPSSITRLSLSVRPSLGRYLRT